MLEGEEKEGGAAQKSMMAGFVLGLLGVFSLLSFQFRSYVEPLIVMVAIPLGLIGAVWGHLLMGLEFTMPSMLGFVSLSGIVVNDSIVLISFVRRSVEAGTGIKQALFEAVSARFRAVILTSLTTIAGLLPLIFESSTLALYFRPIATTICFGLAFATLLVLLVIPALVLLLEQLKSTLGDTVARLTTRARPSQGVNA